MCRPAWTWLTPLLIACSPGSLLGDGTSCLADTVIFCFPASDFFPHSTFKSHSVFFPCSEICLTGFQPLRIVFCLKALTVPKWILEDPRALRGTRLSLWECIYLNPGLLPVPWRPRCRKHGRGASRCLARRGFLPAAVSDGPFPRLFAECGRGRAVGRSGLASFKSSKNRCSVNRSPQGRNRASSVQLVSESPLR